MSSDAPPTRPPSSSAFPSTAPGAVATSLIATTSSTLTEPTAATTVTAAGTVTSSTSAALPPTTTTSHIQSNSKKRGRIDIPTAEYALLGGPPRAAAPKPEKRARGASIRPLLPNEPKFRVLTSHQIGNNSMATAGGTGMTGPGQMLLLNRNGVPLPANAFQFLQQQPDGTVVLPPDAIMNAEANRQQNQQNNTPTSIAISSGNNIPQNLQPASIGSMLQSGQGQAMVITTPQGQRQVIYGMPQLVSIPGTGGQTLRIQPVPLSLATSNGRVMLPRPLPQQNTHQIMQNPSQPPGSNMQGAPHTPNQNTPHHQHQQHQQHHPPGTMSQTGSALTEQQLALHARLQAPTRGDLNVAEWIARQTDQPQLQMEECEENDSAPCLEQIVDKLDSDGKSAAAAEPSEPVLPPDELNRLFDVEAARFRAIKTIARQGRRSRVLHHDIEGYTIIESDAPIPAIPPGLSDEEIDENAEMEEEDEDDEEDDRMDEQQQLHQPQQGIRGANGKPPAPRETTLNEGNGIDTQNGVETAKKEAFAVTTAADCKNEEIDDDEELKMIRERAEPGIDLSQLPLVDSTAPFSSAELAEKRKIREMIRKRGMSLKREADMTTAAEQRAAPSLLAEALRVRKRTVTTIHADEIMSDDTEDAEIEKKVAEKRRQLMREFREKEDERAELAEQRAAAMAPGGGTATGSSSQSRRRRRNREIETLIGMDFGPAENERRSREFAKFPAVVKEVVAGALSAVAAGPISSGTTATVADASSGSVLPEGGGVDQGSTQTTAPAQAQVQSQGQSRRPAREAARKPMIVDQQQQPSKETAKKKTATRGSRRSDPAVVEAAGVAAAVPVAGAGTGAGAGGVPSKPGDCCAYCKKAYDPKRFPEYPQYCSRKCRLKMLTRGASSDQDEDLSSSESPQSSLLEPPSSRSASRHGKETPLKEHLPSTARPPSEIASTEKKKRGSKEERTPSVASGRDSRLAQEVNTPPSESLRPSSSMKSPPPVESSPADNNPSTSRLSSGSAGTPNSAAPTVPLVSEKNPREWNINEVSDWVRAITASDEVTRCFVSEEIDGSALILLTFTDLRESMKLKIGPAKKILDAINDLKQKFPK